MTCGDFYAFIDEELVGLGKNNKFIAKKRLCL